MKEDHLLEELARFARERPDDPDGEALEALCLGTLDAPALAALERRAATDPQLGAWIDAFTPLAPARRAAMAAAVEDVLAADREARARPGPSSGPSGRRFWLPLAAVAALALIWLAVPRGGGAPLPAYTLETSSGTQTIRGGETRTGSRAPVRLAEGDLLTLILRPETRVEGTVTAAAFVERDGRVIALDQPVDIASSGAGRLDLRVGEHLAPEAGAGVVWIAVARLGGLPTAERLAAERSAEPPRNGWRLLRAAFEIVVDEGDDR